MGTSLIDEVLSDSPVAKRVIRWREYARDACAVWS